MTMDEAKQIIRECARQGLETGGRKASTTETIEGWQRAAVEAGGGDMVEAINWLGIDGAAAVYDEVKGSDTKTEEALPKPRPS